MKFEIINRFTHAIQFVAEIDCADDALVSVKLGLAVKWAVKARANLASANLYGANLSGAYLYGADLSGSDLTGSDISRADLTRANLYGADLSGSDLSGSDLTRADLSGANITRADLTRSDLSGTYLYGANLSGAALFSANLFRASLTGAYLYGANLSGAKNADLAIAMTRILPEGDLIGWKQCQGGIIVKLRIPADAKRIHAFGRKCRAEFADVLEVIGAEVALSCHDGKTEYRAGCRVTPDKFDENWMEDCSSGIHFFTQRLEAENYL